MDNRARHLTEAPSSLHTPSSPPLEQPLSPLTPSNRLVLPMARVGPLTGNLRAPTAPLRASLHTPRLHSHSQDSHPSPSPRVPLSHRVRLRASRGRSPDTRNHLRLQGSLLSSRDPHNSRRARHNHSRPSRRPLSPPSRLQGRVSPHLTPKPLHCSLNSSSRPSSAFLLHLRSCLKTPSALSLQLLLPISPW